MNFTLNTENINFTLNDEDIEFKLNSVSPEHVDDAPSLDFSKATNSQYIAIF